MNILLADDHVLFRDGLTLVLGQLGDGVHLLVAGSFDDALAQARRGVDLDLALLDLNMPGMSGASSVSLFREAMPDVPVVVVSASENALEIEQLLDSGAAGYITKTSSARVMLSALRLVLAGGVYVPPAILNHPHQPGAGGVKHGANRDGAPELTERQMEVLRLLLHGKANKVIARELNLSEGTIKIHLAALFRALNANNRTEAAMAARARGWDLSAK